jgi:uncharacterized protein YajQ (UPF0234 family)
MHSFDIVCKIDLQELDNAIQQARREIQTRYDFKGSKTSIEFREKGTSWSGVWDFRLRRCSISAVEMVARISLKAMRSARSSPRRAACANDLAATGSHRKCEM